MMATQEQIERLRVTPQWRKDKHAIWDEVFEQLEDTPVVSSTRRIAWRMWATYAAAAAIALLLMLPGMAYFYTQEVSAPRGVHTEAILPDGSKVMLNAESNMRYKPYWWGVSRHVTLQGEAYFEVAKGKQFSVESTQGMVHVLGTSFNVLARDARYVVTCLTGKVAVESEGQTLTLTPNKQAAIVNRQLTAHDLDQPTAAIDWTQDKFSFTDTPLLDVLHEIERQYNIQIITPENTDYLYTGYFTKDKSPEQVLRIVEKPFNLQFHMKK